MESFILLQILFKNKISQKGQRTCKTLIIKLEKEATQY